MHRAADDAPSPWVLAPPGVTDVPSASEERGLRGLKRRRSVVSLIADWAAGSERGGDCVAAYLKLLLRHPANLTSVALAGAQDAARDPDQSTAIGRFWGVILAAADDAGRTDPRGYRQIDPRTAECIRAYRDDVWLDRRERVRQDPRQKIRAASMVLEAQEGLRL